MPDTDVTATVTPEANADLEAPSGTPRTPPTATTGDTPTEAEGFPAHTAIADMSPAEQAAYWRSKSQRHEKLWKSVGGDDATEALVTQLAEAKAELERIRIEGLSDTEKAIEEAKAAGRAEATTGYGTKLAAAELRAAGVPAEIVGDLDLSKFIDADGEVDTVKVAEVGGRYKALATPGPGSADGGPQGNPPPQQSIDDRIAAARAAGNTELSISLNNQKLAALAAGS